MISKKNFPKAPKELLDTLKSEESFIIIGHKNPDGDTLSSSLALKLVLNRLNKKAYTFNDGPFLRRELKFMEREFPNEIPQSILEDKNTVLVLVDLSSEDRPGRVYEKAKDLRKIIIDHHASSSLIENTLSSYIVPSSPSTTLLIDQIREELNVELDSEIAYYLLIGLMTDTGFFHFLSQDWGPYSLERAAEYLKSGLSLYEVYDQMTDGVSLSEVKETSKVIMNSTSYFSNRLIIAKESKDSGGVKVSDEIYKNLLRVENIEACVYLKRKGDKTEIGFRAKRGKGIDVGKIALSLGGGGHALASGATVDMDIDSAESLVIDIFKKVFFPD